MSILFLSDLHLSAARPEHLKLFEIFLTREAIHAKAVYILGDLFEYWIGEDIQETFQLYIQILFKKLSDINIPLYFLPGNRDFLIHHSFAEQCGMHLIQEPYYIKLGGEKWLLTHGDKECLWDIAHQRYRYWVDQLWLRKFFLKLPGSIRKKIATKLRNGNTIFANKNSVYKDVSSEAIKLLFNDSSLKGWIHGHTHWPLIEYFKLENQYKRRICLPDWHEEAYYLRWDSINGFSIHTIKQNV